ncbi:MAG: putative lipase/acylhydrolase, GDSL-like protein [Candidatus Saccharibacteria bacterium]|nr:putative lipase/acylhydrolase, GDSL-like protein [Candidatus Saccharibacteria bacterium]
MRTLPIINRATSTLAALVLLFFSVGTPSIWADTTTSTTVTLSPTADAFVNTSAKTTNYGKDAQLITSMSQYHSFVRFSTSSIPAGSTITAATLSLYSASSASSGGLRIHPEASTWNEATVTSANQPTWDTSILATSTTPAAGSRATATLPTTAVPIGSTLNWGMDYSVSGTQINLASSNATTVANRPQLTITYTTTVADPTPPVTDPTPPVTDPVPPTGGGSITMPGAAGLLTPDPNPPTLTLSAANAASTIPNPVSVTEASPYVLTRGAHTTRSVDTVGALSDSITPVSTNSFQTYSVELDTDAPQLEIRFHAVGTRYRVWVDGHPINMNATAAPSDGGLYRLKLTFPSAQMHQIRYESDATRFNSFTVSSTDTMVVPTPPTTRAIIVGDSFAEGTGANGRFSTYGQTLCEMAGWDDCWVDGSGGTGYLNNGSAGYANRQTFRQRIVHDVLMYNPDIIVIAGGKNDMSYPVAQVQAEALALFTQIRQTLPNVKLIVTSPFPSSGTQAQSAAYLNFNTALQTAAAGLANNYLDVTGANAYITGTGNSSKPNGTGNADIYTGPDGVHPTPAGHDALGEALFNRYAAEQQ